MALYIKIDQENSIRKMYRLLGTRFTEKVFCRSCARQGCINPKCPECGGKGIHKFHWEGFRASNEAYILEKVDRCPETGHIRYWSDKSNFCYETVTPELNKYCPDVPYGIHYYHDTYKEAEAEVNRVNDYLYKEAKKRYYKSLNLGE